VFTTNQSTKFLSVAILAASAFAGLLASSSASAALVSGNATLTIDNASVAASNPNGWFFQTFWDANNNALPINGSTTGGTALSATGSNNLLLPVNTNTTTQVLSTVTPGRTLQATTMDASNTSVGQIGLSGGLRMRDPSLSSYLAPYDFSLVKTSGQWSIRSFDNQFNYGPTFALTNVSESLDTNGALLLSGDLTWLAGGFTWATLLGANTSTVIGHFSLAPAAVPLPAAVWLFGSALMGVLGIGRRKSAVTA
jgi:hypothetical protein